MPNNHNISRPEANVKIQRFMDIRSELQSATAALTLSDEAREFINSEFISFGFELNQIKNKSTAVDSDAIRVYIAADDFGKPTIIIVPAQYDSTGTNLENKMGAPGTEADQWPDRKNRGNGLVFDIGVE